MVMKKYIIKCLLLVISFIFIGNAQAMQNPLFSGVNRVEIACLFNGVSIGVEIENRLCDLLIKKTADKFGLPVIQNDDARPNLTASNKIMRLGYLWIEARFFEEEIGSINAQLTWGNAKPMRGVEKSQKGDIKRLIFLRNGSSEDEMLEDSAFIYSLLENIKY